MTTTLHFNRLLRVVEGDTTFANPCECDECGAPVGALHRPACPYRVSALRGVYDRKAAS